jgi:hypothetical protein
MFPIQPRLNNHIDHASKAIGVADSEMTRGVSLSVRSAGQSPEFVQRFSASKHVSVSGISLRIAFGGIRCHLLVDAACGCRYGESP